MRRQLCAALLALAAPTPVRPMHGRALQQQHATCPTAYFSAAAAAVTTDCCAGSGHRRLQAGCSVPTTCPTAQCAATFMAFFRDCQQQLVAMSPAATLRDYQALNLDCTALVAGQPAPEPPPQQRCDAMRGDVCDGNACRRFVGCEYKR